MHLTFLLHIYCIFYVKHLLLFQGIRTMDLSNNIISNNPTGNYNIFTHHSVTEKTTFSIYMDYNNNFTIYEEPYEKTPSWHTTFNLLQASMMVLGLILNIFTVITLSLNGRGISRVICLLLKHQAAADTLVCLCGILILATPELAVVGDNVASLLICQVWHSQGIYWSIIWVSIANLEIIAAERFTVIWFPFKHAQLTRSFFRRVILALYPAGVAINIMGYFQLHYSKGHCLTEFYWQSPLMENIMRGHAVWSFLNYNVIPCTVFFSLYGGIVWRLYSRQQQTDLSQSNVIDVATRQLTRTAMVVTGWFVISLSYDTWYYVLGYNGVVEYKKGTLLQKVGIFMSTTNSCVNPIIYVMFMPVFRTSCMATLRCRRQERGSGLSSTASALSLSKTPPTG